MLGWESSVSGTLRFCLCALFGAEEGGLGNLGRLLLLCASVGYVGGNRMRCVIAVIFVPAARPL